MQVLVRIQIIITSCVLCVYDVRLLLSSNQSLIALLWFQM